MWSALRVFQILVVVSREAGINRAWTIEVHATPLDHARRARLGGLRGSQTVGNSLSRKKGDREPVKRSVEWRSGYGEHVIILPCH
jgi:hypothetical protein